MNSVKTILFQGDSITDADRRNGLGTGYPLLTSARLGMDYPGEFTFHNRGISGNRIVDVYARIKEDIINLKPDYMSLLIGVNDVWHEFWGNGVDAPKFEKIYCMMMEEILAALPNVKIMLLEPFCLRGSNTDNQEEHPDKWRIFSSEVKKRAEVVKRVAESYGLPFIPLQALFEEAAARSENAVWLFDGVHPTPAGHELITREWLKTFDSIR
ncbi:MAG: SGNH/GDSL hydrolase family protein [Clostridia bacterium]|nr:SGNH/GDSL hydrolase family protein [Clostridia bacterium]